MLNIVEDWGGFEEFIASLHNTGTVRVEHNVKLPGRDGVKRQIDVLVTHKEGFYEHKILIDCKFWKKNIPREKIDAMSTNIRELNASKGVFFTTRGYQSGAREAAKSQGIEIFKVREADFSDWGEPGPVVELYFQFIRLAPLKAELLTTRKETLPDIRLGSTESTNLIESVDPVEKTLELQIEKVILKGFESWSEENSFLMNKEKDSTGYFSVTIEYRPPNPLILKQTKVPILGANIKIALRVDQTRFRHDRSAEYNYSIIVENCVNESKWVASQRKGTETSTIHDITDRKPNPNSVKNGSVLRFLMKGWFDPKEVEGLAEIEGKYEPLPEGS